MPSISGQHSIVLLIKDIISSAFDQENDALHQELEKAAVLPGPLFLDIPVMLTPVLVILTPLF